MIILLTSGSSQVRLIRLADQEISIEQKVGETFT